jgi:DNA-binding transcriptional ArsR family regulator
VAIDNLSLAFGALSDPTRRAILARLAATGAATVAELAEPFDMSAPAVSKHLKVLERAGLVEAGRQAQSRPRRLVAQPLQEVTEWLERYRPFWDATLDRLDEYVRELKAARDGTDRRRKPRRVPPAARRSKT